jgi:hypothetical protein
VRKNLLSYIVQEDGETALSAGKTWVFALLKVSRSPSTAEKDVADNEGSVAVARRAEFIHEGTMRAHGVWQGEPQDVMLLPPCRARGQADATLIGQICSFRAVRRQEGPRRTGPLSRCALPTTATTSVPVLRSPVQEQPCRALLTPDP